MGLFTVKHIEGKTNPSDIFTKEDKDIEHFVAVRKSIMCDNDFQVIADNKEAEIFGGKDKELQSDVRQDTREPGGCQVGSSPPLTSSTR